MENIYTLKACCALCEYLWDENNCPLFKAFEAARNIGDYTYNNDMQFRMICDEFEINSKFSGING